MNLADWGHKHAKALIFLTGLLCLAGVFLATQMPVALFPRISFPRVLISADAGDMPASQTEIEVTRPLEEAVNAIPGVVDVRSTTSRGSAEVAMNFQWHLDMAQKALQVEAAIAQIQATLPPGTRLEVRRMDPTSYPVIAYSLTSDTLDPIQLRNLAVYTLRPLLIRVHGVAEVQVQGGEIPEELVAVDPGRMLAHHLTMPQIEAALQGTNLISAVGKIQQDYKLYLTLADGRYRTPDQIGDTVLSAPGGDPVLLRDVASITPSTEPRWVRDSANGREAVLFNIIQQPGGNTVQIDHDVKQVLATYRPRLPRGVRLSQFYDQADLVVNSMGSVRDSILIGIALGFLVLLLFLRNFRITTIAVASVPVTVAVTVSILSLMHQSFNIMTLGAIAAAVGLIIDDAIVMVENIVRHLHEGNGGQQAVRKALSELLVPFIASSTSTIVVFAPLAFLSGVTGEFFKPLAITMASSLFVSLLLAIFVVPIVAGHWLGASTHEAEPGRLTMAIERGYGRFMRWLLPRPWVLLLVTGLVLVGNVGLYRTLPNGFLPEMDEGSFVLDYYTDPGTSLAQTQRDVQQIEAILSRVPEVVSFSSRLGEQFGGGLTEPNHGDMMVRLKSGPRRPIDQIIDEVRQQTDQIPGLRTEYAQLMEDMIGDLTSVPEPIEIKVFGDDYGQDQAIATRISQLITSVPNVVDVFDGITIAGPSFHVDVDAVRAGRFGLTANDVFTALQPALQGVVPTQMLEQQQVIGIRVRFPAAYRSDTAAISALPIPTPSGGWVRLDQVATLQEDPGTPEIDRENLKPMIAVTARLSGGSLGGTVDEIRAMLSRKLVLPSGTYLEYGGLYQQQQASFKGLLIVIAAALLLVFTVMLFEFGSFRAPLAIFWVDVLSLFGILLFLWATGTPLNISSMMGAVMIVGIVAENGIFLLHYVREYEREGYPLDEALILAGQIRIRPIVMTTLAAVLALLPLALGLGAGAQMQRPLAIAVIGGFSLSSVLLLMLLPAILHLFSRSGRRPRVSTPVRD